MTLARRSFITGLISFVAAPAIVRAGSLMPVRGGTLQILPLHDDLIQEKNLIAIDSYGAAVWADWARKAVRFNTPSLFPFPQT